MTQQMIEAIRGYLALLNEPANPKTSDLTDLSRTLDQLIRAYHGTSESDLESDATPLHVDASALRRRSQAAFPDLGYYAWVSPEPNTDGPITMGDAIDDIVDIAVKLSAVEWRWQHTSQTDAIAHFNFGFRMHWGRHLLNLKSYLHSIMFQN